MSPVTPCTMVKPLNQTNPRSKSYHRLHKPSSFTKHGLLYCTRGHRSRTLSGCLVTSWLSGLTCAAISDNSIITLFTVDENCGWSWVVMWAISQPHGKIFRDVHEVGFRRVSLPERECVASSPTHCHGRAGCFAAGVQGNLTELLMPVFFWQLNSLTL